MSNVEFAFVTFFGGLFAALLVGIMQALWRVASELRRLADAKQAERDQVRQDRLEAALRKDAR